MQTKITKMDYEGRGISKINKMVTFFPRTLPNEEVEYEIKKKSKHFQVAKTMKIIKASDRRIPSFCPFAEQCGGCVYDIVTYEDSLNLKKEMLSELFLKAQIFLPSIQIVPSEKQLGYRNKVSLKVENHQFGYYEEETHHFVPIQNCQLVDPAIQDLLNDFSSFSFSNGSFTIRTNKKKELYLEINTKEELKRNDEFVKHHQISGIAVNGKCVYKNSYLEEENEYAKYQIPLNSFFQVNPYISEFILKDILSFFTKKDIVYDLYCGCGYFTFPLAKKVQKITGIEVNPNAIYAAQKMIAKNQVSNITFQIGKVEDVLNKISFPSESKIVIDPPRSGLDSKVIAWLKTHHPSMICYLSCNPKTLVRDLKLLEDTYEIIFLKAYDMFCYTKHIEVLTILNHKKL